MRNISCRRCARASAGSLIFTGTFVGYTVGFPGMAPYAASKAGLIGLTQALAVECGLRAIRVNALSPGGLDTRIGRGFAATPEAMAFVHSLHALKRIAQPEEIPQSALYLASSASSFTTGAVLLVDGGVSQPHLRRGRCHPAAAAAQFSSGWLATKCFNTRVSCCTRAS